MILILSFLERPAESLIASLNVIVGIPAYYLFKKTSNSDLDKSEDIFSALEVNLLFLSKNR